MADFRARTLSLIEEAGLTKEGARRILEDEVCAPVHRATLTRWLMEDSRKSSMACPPWVPYVLSIGIRRRGLHQKVQSTETKGT